MYGINVRKRTQQKKKRRITATTRSVSKLKHSCNFYFKCVLNEVEEQLQTLGREEAIRSKMFWKIYYSGSLFFVLMCLSFTVLVTILVTGTFFKHTFIYRKGRQHAFFKMRLNLEDLTL